MFCITSLEVLMNRWLLTILCLVMNSTLYANPTSNHSEVTNKLQNAWKNAQTMTAKQSKDDLLIVYGGEDISLKPTTLKQHTTT
jgi:hypothetical protein